MPVLIISKPPLGPRRFTVRGPTASIGRRPTNDIVVLDPTVSGHHCRLEHTGGRWCLFDLKSRAGTYLNGKLITAGEVLRDGDELRLGRTQLEWREDAPARAPRPAGDGRLRTVFVARHSLNQIVSRLPSRSEEDFPSFHELPDQEELASNYERLRLAHKLSRSIGGLADEDALLSKILDVVMENFEVDRGVVLMVDRESGELETRKIKITERMHSTVVEVPSSILEEVTRSRQAVLCADASSDERFHLAQSVHLQGIHSSMSVPLVSGTEGPLLGIIYVDSLSLAGLFTPKDLAILTTAAGQAAQAIQNIRMNERLTKAAAARQFFSRLLPPSLVEKAMNGSLVLQRGGTNRKVAVLMSDIRGFTALSATVTAQEVVAMLNEYFERMVDIAFEFEGTLDKFMGDGLMVLFGAPADMEDACGRAVACAVRMQQVLAEWNLEREVNREPTIRVGIGIEYDNLVAGMVGSTKALNYTVVGSGVNRASRLCSAAGPGQILVTEKVLSGVPDARFRDLGDMELKGLGATPVFEVVGQDPAATLDASIASSLEDLSIT